MSPWYYGRPVEYGHGVSVVTRWKARGVLFDVTEVLVKQGDAVVAPYTLNDHPKAVEHATRLMLDEGKRRRLIRESQ